MALCANTPTFRTILCIPIPNEMLAHKAQLAQNFPTTTVCGALGRNAPLM